MEVKEVSDDSNQDPDGILQMVELIPTATYGPQGGEGTEVGKEKTALSLLREANQNKSCIKHFVCDGGGILLKEARKGNVEKVVDLLCRGVPFIADSTGVSSLHYAAYNNSVEITELLLNGGILRDFKNKVERTPLHIAAQMNHITVLKTLLTFGADQDAIDMMKMTPLHWASENGNVSCVKLLLLYGAKYDAVDVFGRTPLDLSGNSEIRTLLNEHASKLRINKMSKSSDTIFVDSESEKGETRDQVDMDDAQVEHDNCSEQDIISNSCKSDCQSSNPIMDSLSESFMDNDKDPMELLKEHGIQMLEPDKITTVHSAMESGRKIVLTEAGKLALDTALKQDRAKRRCPPETSSQDSLIVLRNGEKFIKVHRNHLKKFHLDRDRSFFSLESEQTSSFRNFKGKHYSEDEEDDLKILLQSTISKLRNDAQLLDIFSKRKFRQANAYQQQLLQLLKSKKNQAKSKSFEPDLNDSS